MTATDQLAEFVAATRLADIPADVIDRGRLVLADCIGCMVAGAVVPEVRRLVWRLVWARPLVVAAVVHWSYWRRRHQLRAKRGENAFAFLRGAVR